MLQGRKFGLFLERIHPFKGPETLVRACAKLGPDFRGHLLILGGPDVSGHGKRILAEADALGIGHVMLCTGQVVGRLKNGLLANATVLVLPSNSENFGNVVVEALACSTPMIANQNALWQLLEKYACGWCIEAGIATLCEVVEAAINVDDGARHRMGVRGKRLA